jgi:ketosteroid isomerase-like protein
MKQPSFALLGTCVFALAAYAQPDAKPKEDPAHDELRAVKKGVEEALKKRDIDSLLKYLDNDVVVTWQNAETKRGHEGVKEFNDRMMKGENSVVVSLDSKIDVDDLSILHGRDTAVAFGTLDDHFRLRDGMEFDLHSRWTATLVKKNDRWLIASVHVGSNIFDNGVLSLALGKSSLWIGGIAAAVGLLVGIVLALLIRRTRRQPG